MVLLSSGKPYLKATDISRGDILTFVDEGAWEESKTFKRDDGTPQVGFYMTVKHKGEEKKCKITKASQDELKLKYGLDTKEWIGQNAEADTIPTPNGKKSIFLRPITETQKDTEWDD